MTPTETEGAISNPFTTPSIGIIVGGRLLDSGVNDCDTAGLKAVGFEWRLDAEVTVGTPFPFFAEFFIPESLGGEIELLVLGRATGDSALYFEPTVLPELPTP